MHRHKGPLISINVSSSRNFLWSQFCYFHFTVYSARSVYCALTGVLESDAEDTGVVFQGGQEA